MKLCHVNALASRDNCYAAAQARVIGNYIKLYFPVNKYGAHTETQWRRIHPDIEIKMLAEHGGGWWIEIHPDYEKPELLRTSDNFNVQ